MKFQTVLLSLIHYVEIQNPNDKFDNRYHQFWQYLTATYDNEINKTKGTLVQERG